MAQTTTVGREAFSVAGTPLRAIAAAVAIAIALVFMAVQGPAETTAGSVQPAQSAGVAFNDDYITRHYLPQLQVSGQESWKDDYVTRRYQPGS
jgi:hypothetical protein